MTRRMVFFLLCGGVAALGAACATKDFVRQEVGASERKLGDQMTATETSQDAKLRETSDRVGETRQAIDQADQRLNGLDLRVGEAGARASSAETRASETEARLSQRLAGRNRYRLVETKVVYFDSGQTEVRSQDAGELESVAKALTEDPNAVLELQGFADPRGNERYNRELARERVEAVMRYLVQRHGVELRQVRAIAMGKAAWPPARSQARTTLPGPGALTSDSSPRGRPGKTIWARSIRPRQSTRRPPRRRDPRR